MRLQEFYESPLPGIRGKYFSIEDFMDAYAKAEGDFSYTSDWEAFNVPDVTIRAFVKVFYGHPMLEKERELFDKLAPLLGSDRKFYLVGMAGNEIGYLQHELAHAYYYLFPEYKAMMKRLSRQFRYKKEIRKALMKNGYCAAVVADEVQAYLATGTKASNKADIEFTSGYKSEWKPFRKYFRLFDK
jgi:hypothetical protein